MNYLAILLYVLISLYIIVCVCTNQELKKPWNNQ